MPVPTHHRDSHVPSCIGPPEMLLNVDLLMRIYLTMLITHCSGERSFSTLKHIKNNIRSSMGDDRLNHLSILCIENYLTRSLDFKHVIETFSAKKARKMKLLCIPLVIFIVCKFVSILRSICRRYQHLF